MSEFLSAASTFCVEMFSYMMIAIFLENTIFSRALGTSTALFAVRKRFNVFLFGLIMTVIITVASLITYFINPLLSTLPYKYYITPVVYVLIISVIYIVALIITGRAVIKRRDEVLSIIHVSSFNCAVLGAIMLASNISDASLAQFLGFGIGTGIGFTLVTYFMTISAQKLESEDIPRSFRGFPITLIYIGIISLAIYGLIGHELPF